MISIISMIWHYIDSKDIEKVKDLSISIFWMVIPSLILFLSIPILILIRFLIGWNYILKRLKSKIVEYEETDWHDGQKWLKSESDQTKDGLIANLEVIPTIRLLRKSLIYILIVAGLSSTYLIYSTN